MYLVVVAGGSLHPSEIWTQIISDFLWRFPFLAELFPLFALNPNEFGLFLAIPEEDRSSMQRGGADIIVVALRA